MERGKSFTKMWSESPQLKESFENAKLLLIKAVTLNFPDPEAPLALSTDASKMALGASLDQWVGGAWRPLGFWSKALKPQQQQYTTFRREVMAIQLAMRYFHDQFEGRNLIVFTDHKPILGTFRSQELQLHDPLALNAINEIAMFTSDIRHKPGKDLVVPDLLSRPPEVPIGQAYEIEPREIKYVPPEKTIAALNQVALQILTPEALAKSQKNCPRWL